MPYNWQDDAQQYATARLQQDVTALPTVNWELELRAVNNRLQSRFAAAFAPIGGFNEISPTDLEFWAEGIGILTAIRLRSFLPKALPLGEILGIKQGGDDYKFSQRPVGAKPMEQVWLEDALEAIGRVTPIQQMYLGAAYAFNVFTVSGPTRTAIANGVHESLLSSVIRSILTDDWDADLDFDRGIDC